MPCQSWGEDDVREVKVIDPQTKKDLDKYKRAFCEMSEAFSSFDETHFLFVLSENSFLEEVYSEHSIEDERRWFKVYSKAHPAFNEKEIAKMVRQGILKRV